MRQQATPRRRSAAAKARGARKAQVAVRSRSAALGLPPSMGLGYGIARLARLIARDATRRVSEVLGLTLAEWRLLLLMHSDGENHLDALAERALLEKSHASVAATTLAEKKLIVRTVSAEDRRRVYFTRTALGNRAVDTYLAATTNERSQLWGTLSDAEQISLRHCIDRLLDAAEKRLCTGRSRKKFRDPV